MRDAVDDVLLPGVGDVDRRGDQPDRAFRRRWPARRRPGPPGRAPGRAVHVGGPPVHRESGVDVLRDRVLEEALRRDDRHAPASTSVREHALDAAEVVGVRVGVDHGRDRPVAAVLR